MNVPKIRYDNFTKEWEKVKLSSQASFLQGLTYTPNDVSNDGTIVLRSSNIQNSMVDYNDIVRVNIIIPEKLKIKENDILMCVRNGSKSLVGKTAWLSKNEEKCTWGAFMNIIRPKERNKFVYYYLNSKYFYNHVWKDLGTATVNQITKQTLESCYLNIPSIEEQEKISNTLSLLDQKIKLQSKKIEDLKLFKKGLINVLNKKSYQETALGKIGKFQTSSIDKLIKENEKIVNLYNYMDVYKHKILMTQDLSKLSKTSAKDNQITINNLKRGDILFTPSSETPDDIGHSTCIQEDLPNTVYSYHLLRYRPNIIMDPLFSNYYFNNSKIRKQIIRYATGATRYTISLDSFLKIKVNIPDLITQKKYGLLLYSTDKKVNKELLKLNKLQELKKGLMQNMFV